jgi:hypothetical protein
MSVTLAELQARADGGQFTLTQTANTPLVAGSEPIQKTHPLQRLVPHGSPSRTAIAWSAVYRSWILKGDVLVVDSAVASSFLHLVLDHAWTVFDSVDLRLNLYGVPPNATRASPPAVGQTQTLPGLTPSGGT